METSSTKQDTVVATTPIAFYAVASHMIDRRLPAPIAIDAPLRSESRVRVSVASADVDEWLDSMLVDDERHSIRNAVGHSYERTEYLGRIPSAVGDVAVTVSTVQLVSRLASVATGRTGGVA